MSTEKSPKEYIKESFKNFYTVLKTKFIKISDIVDNYTSDSVSLPLSAAKGKDLNNRMSLLEKSANKLLWDGGDTGHLLKEGDANLSLSEKITSQYHGIVLVFALRNSTGKANTNIHTFYIPKALVGNSYDCCGIDTTGKIFVKHIYISDDKIHTITSKETNSEGNCACNIYGPNSNHTNPDGKWISDVYALIRVYGV